MIARLICALFGHKWKRTKRRRVKRKRGKASFRKHYFQKIDHEVHSTYECQRRWCNAYKHSSGYYDFQGKKV